MAVPGAWAGVVTVGSSEFSVVAMLCVCPGVTAVQAECVSLSAFQNSRDGRRGSQKGNYSPLRCGAVCLAHRDPFIDPVRLSTGNTASVFEEV